MNCSAWLAPACAIVLTACTATTPVPYPPVPPLLAERVPAPPRASVPLIWQPGHHEWDGKRYNWVAG